MRGYEAHLCEADKEIGGLETATKPSRIVGLTPTV